MATRREESPGHESVILENDEGVDIRSNRTTTHMKSRVFVRKNTERVLIGKKLLVLKLKRIYYY